MFRFENPLDPSKDGMNPFIDGIRYHLRDSEAIKEEVIRYLHEEPWNVPVAMRSSLEILEAILKNLGYKLDDLTISDEHELLDEISACLC